MDAAGLALHTDGVNHQWLVDLVIKNDTGQSYSEIEKSGESRFFQFSPAGELGPCAGAQRRFALPHRPRTGPQLTCGGELKKAADAAFFNSEIRSVLGRSSRLFDPSVMHAHSPL